MPFLFNTYPMKHLLSLFLLSTAPLLSAQTLDTVFAEAYAGFNQGELGDCLSNDSPCPVKYTRVYPLERIPDLSGLLYKRIYYDSTQNQISREYIRESKDAFVFAAYSPQRNLMQYGRLFSKYKPLVCDTVFEYDSAMQQVPKHILAIRPIELQKTGLWQEQLKVGYQAGYYLDNTPVGIWKYYSLSFFVDFDLPSQVWNYSKSGALVKRDTLNFLEKKHTKEELTTQLVATNWVNAYEDDKFLILGSEIKKIPCEVWFFKPDGTVEIKAFFTKESFKSFKGTWAIKEPLDISIEIPEFANTTLKLRYLDSKKKMLLLK